MLLRELFSPNNSQSRRGLKQDSAVAGYWAAGWAITGICALVLLQWSPLASVLTLFLVGSALQIRGSSFSPSRKQPPVDSAFLAMPAHLAALDGKGNVILVNDAWRQFAVRNGFRGQGHGEGVNYIELCESATGECAAEAWQVAAGIRNVLDGKQDAFSIEYPCHSPTEQRWFRCLVSRFPGDEQGALVTHLDITEQVKMRTQVKELKTEQAAILEQKEAVSRRQSLSAQEIVDLRTALDEHAMVAICNRNGRILSVNRKYCEVSGFTEGQLIGSNVHLQDVPARSDALRDGEIWKGEVCHQTRNGQAYWLEETIVPFHNEFGGISQIVVIGTDITARKKAEASLTDRTEELAKTNAALAEFAFLASHDLQEPLRGVRGCVQLLANRYNDLLDTQGRELIRHAVQNTERMQSLISGLLDLSRIDRSPATPSKPVDVQSLIDRTVVTLQQAIQESGAEIELSGPFPLLQGDVRQIGQIFQNLIANSIKFRSKEPPRIRIYSLPEQVQHIEFVVRDNGIGIEPRHADRIFGIFQKLHAPGRFPGAGIGLAIVKRIVERHGGRIWVQTLAPDDASGTEFHFTLPLPAVDKPAEVPRAQRAGATQ